MFSHGSLLRTVLGCEPHSILTWSGDFFFLGNSTDYAVRLMPMRRTRGPHGAGCYPVLEALGIADRVSPATRSEIALHVVQAASYREAAAMLARRGLSCDVSSLVRISTVLASASIRLRD